MAYLILRHGSNAANQHMCEVAPLGVYGDRDPAAAKREAAEQHTVYNNQYLSAIPVSRAPRGLLREALEQDALRVAHQAACEHNFEHGRCNFCDLSQ